MPAVEILLYTGIFLGLYFAIFVLTTFFELREKTAKTLKPKPLPAVCLIVPCYNEEGNVSRTLQSLLNLDYPKEALEITVVDDGSRDNTFQEAKGFADKDPRIKVFRKENGGKYTALNYGLARTNSPFVGSVDGDSYLHPKALQRIMRYFNDPSIMAVISTVKIGQAKGVLGGIQAVEFLAAAFLRKSFSLLHSVNVTPGPLSVFKKEVFETLGPYRKGHQTEDLEIAFRMQKANYKIAHAVDAMVYTNACSTLKSLFKQRLRWKRGFLLNLKDYPELLNIKKHGNLSFLMLYNIVGSVISIFLASYSLWKLGELLARKVKNFSLVGSDMARNFLAHISPSSFKPDWFSFNITPALILSALALLAFFCYLFISKKMTSDQGPMKGVVFYILFYSFFNAAWWVWAFFSAVLQKEISWE